MRSNLHIVGLPIRISNNWRLVALENATHVLGYVAGAIVGLIARCHCRVAFDIKRIFIVIFATVIANKALGDTTLSQPDPAHFTAKELIAAIKEGLTSIDSLYCEFTVDMQTVPAQKTSFRYARSGSRWHYTQFPVVGSLRATEHLQCCNDDVVFVVRKSRGSKTAGSDICVANLEDARPFNYSLLNPDEVIGRRLIPLDYSVTELLEKASSDVAAQVQDETPPGIGIRLPSMTERNGKLIYDVSATVDPDHDFLFREIVIKESKENLTWPEWERHWKINEFQRVLDQRTNKERWFPSVAEMSQGKTDAPKIVLRVEKVTINAVLSGELFSPPIPDGATVFDYTTSGRGRAAVKGSHHVVDNRIKEVADRALKSLSTPTSPTRKWLVAANVFVIVLLALLIYGRQRSRNALN